MNFKEIQELIRLVSKSDLSEFKMKQADFEVTIKTNKAIKQVGIQQMSYAPTPLMQAPMAVSGTKSNLESDSESSAPSAPKAENELKKYLEIKSPMVGTFYRSPGPDKAPFITVGDRVDAGSPVCIIEAMKLFNEIESEIKGTIVKIVAEDASPVEYDQVLFLVEA